jgi:hypothetical protein
MSTLVNQVADSSTRNNNTVFFESQDLIDIGATNLEILLLNGVDLSLVRTGSRHASANALVCAFILAIIALLCAYVLQWTVLYSKNRDVDKGRKADVRTEITQMREV